MFWCVMGLVCSKVPPEQQGLLSLKGIIESQGNKTIRLSLCPPAHFCTTKTHYKIMVDVPGVVAQDIQLAAERQWVYIAVKKRQQGAKKDQRTHANETSYRAFKRELLLPDDALTGSAYAKLQRSTLSIIIPRKSHARKAIAIQTV